MSASPYSLLPGNVTPQANAFFNSLVANEEGGAKSFLIPLQFPAGGNLAQNIKFALNEIGLFAFQSLYVDNSQAGAPLSILINGTRQLIIVPPYAQGFYRVMGDQAALDLTVSSNVGLGNALATNVTLLAMNIVADEGVTWYAVPPNQPQGQQIGGSNTGAASAATVTLTGQAGRTILITGVTVSGLGATAGSGINLSFTNINIGGVATTYNVPIAVPAGVGVALSPEVINFNPGLAVMPGLSSVVTLPSFGAGNTFSGLSVQAMMV